MASKSTSWKCKKTKKEILRNCRIFKLSNFRKGFEGFATYVLGKTGVSLQTSLCPDYFVPHHQFEVSIQARHWNSLWGLHTPPQPILEATLAMATEWSPSGNNRTLGYCAPLTSEQPENACCHNSGASLALLTTLAKKQTPVSFNWGKQFLPHHENFAKNQDYLYSGTLFQEKPSNVCPQWSCNSEILISSNPETLLACIKSISKILLYQVLRKYLRNPTEVFT